MSSFSDLRLASPLLRALEEKGYKTPSPIQKEAIPYLLAGRDLLGLAQTGTGKTAAFALPILQHIITHHKAPAPKATRALILAPTRELATQIDENFREYARHTPIRQAVIFGGIGQNRQVEAMRRGVDVLVAAPGRLLDLMGQGFIDLSSLEILVLDEADRMLDMGFIHDIRRIMTHLPKQRQTLLFSATMPKTIAELADKLLHNAVRVEITPPSSTVDRIRQAALFIDTEHKKESLLMMMRSPKVTRAVVFTLMKHEANKVASFLNENGIAAEAIHGNKSQGARERAMSGFRNGSIKALVATDIAARGIDVDDVSHVFNYDLPNIAESYVHRIGRTARAGREGWAVSFCDAEQRAWLHAIEKNIGKPIPVMRDHPHHSETAERSTLPPPVLGGGRRQPGRPGARRPNNNGPARPASARPQGGKRESQPGKARRRYS